MTTRAHHTAEAARSAGTAVTARHGGHRSTGTGSSGTGSTGTGDTGPGPGNAGSSPSSSGGAGCSSAQLEALRHRLETTMPALLEEVRSLLERDWPDYAAFLAEQGEGVTSSAGIFVSRLLAVASGDTPAGASGGDAGESPVLVGAIEEQLFETIGREQCRMGRDVTTLLAAYQVGARAAWRHVSAAGLDLELEPDLLAALAEGVFEFVGELSSASAHGFAQEQSESSRAREQLRDELTQLLLSGRAPHSAVQAAATRARWALPREAAVVLVDPSDERGREVVGHADASCLRVRDGAAYGLVVPDPSGPGRSQRLLRALQDTRAVVGHTVRLAHLPASLRVALLARRLQSSGVLPPGPVVVEDHLDSLVVHADDQLLGSLRRQVLAPLDVLSVNAQTRMTETLTSWLRHGTDRHAVARELAIHPQTVKYRLNQLYEVFGPALDDPHVRSRLFLALVWGPPGGD